MAPHVKDLALLQQWLGLLPRRGFDPWPGNVLMLLLWPKTKTKKQNQTPSLPLQVQPVWKQGLLSQRGGVRDHGPSLQGPSSSHRTLDVSSSLSEPVPSCMTWG